MTIVEEQKGMRQTSGIGREESVATPTYEGDFILEEHLLLDCGRALVRPTLHYAVYGRMNESRTNAVLVCHALSGSALVGSWWPGLFGKPGEPGTGIVNLEHDCVICINLLGSCYGSTGPGSINPEVEESHAPGNGPVYGPDFPLISIADNVRAQARLLDSLGIRRVKLAIGGSIGGMQVLDWSILFPDRVQRAVVIAVAPLGAMGLALNHLQRQAIQSDPDWEDGRYLPFREPRRGLAMARQIAMLSYKSRELFAERFGRNPNRKGDDPWALDDHGGGLVGGRFDVAGFLDYQGERFLERFDANSYLAILRTMDTWDPAHAYRSPRDAYGRIQADLIFVGISSDWLFPASDVRQLAESVEACGVRAEYREMVTTHGHDAFLAEQDQLVKLLDIA
jgi:homoserine O-acetyltransferase